MIGKALDTGSDLRGAIINIIQTKLIGTWRMAVISVEDPSTVYVTKNVGPCFLGTSKDNVVICQDKIICDSGDFSGLSFQKLKSNILYEIKDNCQISKTKLQRNIQVSRKPKRGYDHIFEEEVFESLDAMDAVSDDGAKFISSHQVVLGGFEHAKEELTLIQNLVICANGNSVVAAKYGAHLLRHLEVFNTVKVVDGDRMGRKELERLKYAGFMTLSQSGDRKNLIDGLIEATKLGVTCINVVNVEDSPITKVI